MKSLKLFCGILAAGVFTLSAYGAGFEKTLTYTEGRFADVPETEWYAKEVKSAYETGLMQGISDSEFNPKGNVTVAQAITMASRAASMYYGEEISTSGKAWYDMYVNYAKEHGFVSDGQFDSYDRPAKRSEVAQLFALALPKDYYNVINEVSEISDVPQTLDSHDEILTLYRAGIVMGSDSYGNFLPENNITRAEAAAVINRVAIPGNRLKQELDRLSGDDAYILLMTPTWNGQKEGINSGWQLDNRGGVPRTSLTDSYGSLIDVDEKSGTALIREFNQTATGKLRLYTSVVVGGDDGVFLEFRNGKDESVYRLQTVDNAWCVRRNDGSFLPVFEFANGQAKFDFAVDIDIDNFRSTTYINGKDCGTFEMTGAEKNIKNLRLATTEESLASAAFGSVYIYANYSVCENFSFCESGALPIGWEGEASGEAADKLEIGAEGFVVTSFTPVSQKAVSEFKFLSGANQSFAYTLSSGNKIIAVVSLDSSGLYLNGELCSKDISPDMWYRVRLELDTDAKSLLLKLNGRKTGQAKFAESTTSVDVIRIENSGDVPVKFDEFCTFRVPEHTDYVPEPKLPSDKDEYLVGINACSLWQNGSHYGWACISPYSDIEPVLGYYDEGLPETADWEIKYQLEHGIDFQAFCVFFGDTWPQIPTAGHLFDGYMNAKYSDLSKFCIIWEAANAASPTSMQVWKEKYVPYFIENFFKDPRHVVVDNKPILCVFGASQLSTRIGGDDKVKEMFDYLDSEVKKIGFDGVIYLCCGSSTDRLFAMGFDGCCAYNWGKDGYKESVNKESMLNSAKQGAVYTVPTVSVGFNSIAWHGTRYPMMSAEDFRSTNSWVKDEYLPAYAKEDWQKKLVMLSTWNEYGEGTYIMPTVDEKGFGYLDALRETYTDEKADASLNTVPTEAQKNRINRLYPQELRLLRKEGVYTDSISAEDLVPIYTIDYSKVTATPSNCWGMTGAQTTAKGISGTSGKDAIVILNNLSAAKIDLDNVAAISITAKIPKGSVMGLYFITESDTAWNEAKHVKFEESVTDDFATYTVSTSGLSTMKGRLKGVRVDPVQVSDLDFVLSKTEFQKPKNSSGISKKMTINTTGISQSFAPMLSETGDVLVAFDPSLGMDFLLNTYHTWDKKNGRLTLEFTDHKAVYTVGSDSYILDGSEKKLGYKLFSIDALPMLPIEKLCADVGYTYTLDEKNRILIETPQKSYFDSLEKKKVYAQWEFDTIGSTEKWKSAFMSLLVSNGYMACESSTSSTDPTIVLDDSIAIDTSKYKSIEYRVRYKYSSDKEQALTMYFATDKAPGYNQNKIIRIPLKSQDSGMEWEEYTLDLTSVESWKDTVTSLRFDPFNAVGHIDIDYIRFIPDSEEAAPKTYEAPDIPLESAEYGTLVWYNNFDNADYNEASFAAQEVQFTSGGVVSQAEIVDNPDSKKKDKVLKLTPTGEHGGYEVKFTEPMKAGDYTFVFDIYLPNGEKKDVWLRYLIYDEDGNKSDPNEWNSAKYITQYDTWCAYTGTRTVEDDSGLHNFSIRKVTNESYYIDNVRIYYKP